MRKFFTILTLSMFLSVFGFSQTVIYEDDFEAMTAGDLISTSDYWSTWGGTSGTTDDAFISNVQNHTVDGLNSLKIVSGDDIVGYFGDKSSGAYEINFYMFMETSKGGYFNIEHAFGNIWAFSVSFKNNGTATLDYNNNTSQAFTYTQNAWIPVSMLFDLDADEATLTIEGNELAMWQFSTAEGSTEMSNFLDCINFYGASSTGLNSSYYVDDFEFVEVTAGTLQQELDVDITEIMTDGTSSANLNITNLGEDNLTFEAYAYYPNPMAKGSNQATVNANPNISTKTVILSPITQKYDKPVALNIDSKDVILSNQQSDITTNLGWTNEITISAVTLFDHNAVADYVGMQVSNLIIFSGDATTGTSTADVWEGFTLNNNGPTNLMASQEFTPAERSQVQVDLTNPVFVNGKDLWVGWTFTQPAGAHCLAMDGGPILENKNFVKAGPVWSAINDTDYGNFGIIATLTGTAIPTWLNIDINSGVIAGAAIQPIELSFDLTGLSTGTYTCTVVIDNNDVDEAWYEIPVTLDVVTSTENNNSDAVMTFPNPAYNELNIVSDLKVNTVEFTTIAGQTVKSLNLNTKSAKISLSDMAAGVYFVKINTDTKTVTKQVIVK